MAHFKVLAHRMIIAAAWTAVGVAALGGAYAAGDAAYALGGFAGSG
jgi:hypothetical protein